MLYININNVCTNVYNMIYSICYITYAIYHTCFAALHICIDYGLVCSAHLSLEDSQQPSAQLSQSSYSFPGLI